MAHAAGVSFCQVLGERRVTPWEELPRPEQDVVVAMVRGARCGATPRGLHDTWYEVRLGAGWVWGPAADPEAKQHPSLMPYDRLPESQKDKDWLFLMVVSAMTLGMRN